MSVRTVDDKPSDTLVVVSGEGSWTGSSTLPHLHQLLSAPGQEVLPEGPQRTDRSHDRQADVAGRPKPGVSGLEDRLSARLTM
jgi:hypothetical protein